MFFNLEIKYDLGEDKMTLYKKINPKEIDSLLKMEKFDLLWKLERGEIPCTKYILPKREDGEIEIRRALRDFSVEHIIVSYSHEDKLARAKENQAAITYGNTSYKFTIGGRNSILTSVRTGKLINNGDLYCPFTVDRLRKYYDDFGREFLIVDLDIHDFYLLFRNKQIIPQGFYGLVPLEEQLTCDFCGNYIKWDFDHFLEFKNRKSYISHYKCEVCNCSRPYNSYRSAYRAYNEFEEKTSYLLYQKSSFTSDINLIKGDDFLF